MKRLICAACLLLLQSAVAMAEQVCLENIALSTSPQERFISHADGSIEDVATNLIWRACLEGQLGQQCTGEATHLNWAEALLYPSKINQGEEGPHWRLPNIRELSTLLELRCFGPAVNLAVFPGISSSEQVWTSSPYHFYTHYSWYVDFGPGAVTYDERIRKKALWLVRNYVK